MGSKIKKSETSTRLTLLASAITLLTASWQSVAAPLAGTTAASVQGHAPIYMGGAANDKLGVKINGVEYTKLTNPNAVLSIGKAVKLSDVVGSIVITESDYAITDADGDADKISDTHLYIDTPKIEWVYGPTSTLIPAAALNVDACQFDLTAYPNPKVIVKANFVPKTSYGDPNEGKSEEVVNTYAIDIDCNTPTVGKILYVKPVSLFVPKRGAASNFNANYGFALDAGFPTTGFTDASFSFALDGAPEPSAYTLKSDNEEVAVVDNQGNVKLKSIGKATISIYDLSNKLVDTYSFNIRKWYIQPKTTVCAMEGALAVNDCTTICSNEPKALGYYSGEVPFFDDLGNATDTKSYVRGVGNGLLAEWGKLNEYHEKYRFYTTLNTKDKSVTGGHKGISSSTGTYVALSKGTLVNILCKVEF